MPTKPWVFSVCALSSTTTELGAGVLAGLLGLVDHLGQAPVEHDHLAEAAEHDVFGLQVAVDHAARVGVADRLADLDERLQQLVAARAGSAAFPPGVR